MGPDFGERRQVVPDSVGGGDKRVKRSDEREKGTTIKRIKVTGEAGRERVEPQGLKEASKECQ